MQNAAFNKSKVEHVEAAFFSVPKDAYVFVDGAITLATPTLKNLGVVKVDGNVTLTGPFYARLYTAINLIRFEVVNVVTYKNSSVSASSKHTIRLNLRPTFYITLTDGPSEVSCAMVDGVLAVKGTPSARSVFGVKTL